MDSEEVSVRLPRILLDGIDAAIASEPDPKPRRPEAIRRALAEWLQSRRLLPAAPGRTLRDAVQGNRAATQRRKEAAAQAGED